VLGEHVPEQMHDGEMEYSMYTMFPSPLMSPNIFKTEAVDPFRVVDGTIPVEKPPCTLSESPDG